MKLKVSVRTGTWKDGVEEREDGTLLVRVRELPERGRANLKLIKLLARFFNVPADSVRIRTGARSREKIVEISMNAESS